jgi:propionyl-CoA carboxylase beta chain
LHPFEAAGHGYIDAVIEPNETRAQIMRALHIIKEKVEELPAKRSGLWPV